MTLVLISKIFSSWEPTDWIATLSLITTVLVTVISSFLSYKLRKEVRSKENMELFQMLHPLETELFYAQRLNKKDIGQDKLTDLEFSKIKEDYVEHFAEKICNVYEVYCDAYLKGGIEKKYFDRMYSENLNNIYNSEVYKEVLHGSENSYENIKKVYKTLIKKGLSMKEKNKKPTLRKYWWIGSLIIFISSFVCIWYWWTNEVYGQPEFFRAMRSDFIKDVVVPILGSIIAFGGIAFSVNSTIKSNLSIREKTDKLELQKIAIVEKYKYLNDLRNRGNEMFESLDAYYTIIIQSRDYDLAAFKQESNYKNKEWTKSFQKFLLYTIDSTISNSITELQMEIINNIKRIIDKNLSNEEKLIGLTNNELDNIEIKIVDFKDSVIELISRVEKDLESIISGEV